MNTRMIGFLLGRILMVEAGLLALPLLTALLYGEPLMPWLATMLVLAAIGWGLSLRKPERTALYAKDGFAAVALVWLLMSAFGALPFVLSGDIPNYIDAFFETVSGFTTTGASILTAVEPLSRGGLLWRSFTHWVGGMGVLVFVMAILPMSDGAHHAHPPGRDAGAYGGQAGQPHERYRQDPLRYVFCHDAGDDRAAASGRHGPVRCQRLTPSAPPVPAAFPAGTPAWAPTTARISTSSPAYRDAGLRRQLQSVLLPADAPLPGRGQSPRSCGRIWASWPFPPLPSRPISCHLYGAVGTALRHAFFQVSSIITTTGYATVDFDQWPGYAKTVLGAADVRGRLRRFHRRRSEGHPCGDVGRRLPVLDMRKMLHPNAVVNVRMEGRAMPEKQVAGRTGLFLRIYAAVRGVLAAAESERLRSAVHLHGADAPVSTTSVPALRHGGPHGELLPPLRLGPSCC